MGIEGVVCKWQHRIYEIGGNTTSWLKLKNAHYSHMGRTELFATRAEGDMPRGRYVSPRLLLA
jgi:ATP-dependent DNA ligase